MMKDSIDIRPRHFSVKVPEIFIKTWLMNFHCPSIFPHKKSLYWRQTLFKTYYLRSINACPIIIPLNEFSLPVNFFRIKKVCTGDKLFFKTYYLRSINACPIIIPVNEFSLPVNLSA